MNTPDLSQLHDFYQPAPPSWMPQTVGWYVVFAILTALLLWFCIRVLQRWIKNRYRRDALRELQLTPVDRLSEILKRTAMVTWPRERAASLTGARWITFLHDTSNLNGFNFAPGNLMEEVAIRKNETPPSDEENLRALAAKWIKVHHV